MLKLVEPTAPIFRRGAAGHRVVAGWDITPNPVVGHVGDDPRQRTRPASPGTSSPLNVSVPPVPPPLPFLFFFFFFFFFSFHSPPSPTLFPRPATSFAGIIIRRGG